MTIKPKPLVRPVSTCFVNSGQHQFMPRTYHIIGMRPALRMRKAGLPDNGTKTAFMEKWTAGGKCVGQQHLAVFNPARIRKTAPLMDHNVVQC